MPKKKNGCDVKDVYRVWQSWTLNLGMYKELKVIILLHEKWYCYMRSDDNNKF